MPSERLKYHVQLNFTDDRQEALLPRVMTTAAAVRLIIAEQGMEPSCVNHPGDVRYDTDDPVKALELLKYAFTIADGGWWSIQPMPERSAVFHLPRRHRD